MPAPRKTRERGSVPWAARRETPSLTTPEWMEGAACRNPQIDPEVFFPPKGESATPGKTVCLSCPERATCLDWAMETGQDEFGTLGGKTAQERRKLKRDALKAAAAHQAAPMKQGEKQCNGCGETKSLNDFHQNRTNSDGQQARCITCRSEHRKLKRAEEAA